MNRPWQSCRRCLGACGAWNGHAFDRASGTSTAQGLALRYALARAGFRPYELGTAEAQLRRLGRVRGLAMLDWLARARYEIETFALSRRPRVFAVEEFIVRLAGE